MSLITKFAIPLTGAMLLVSGAAHAIQVPGVYNTGLGPNGATLPAGDGQIDANYVVTASDRAGIMTGVNARTYYNPAYLQDGPLSRIVNATGDGSGVAGTTTSFSTTFSLAGFDSANATISGQVLFDNLGTIFLNGNQVGGTYTGFASLTPFGTNANFFLAGLNTLTFNVFNQGGPEALQVAGLTVTAERLAGAVPEPTTWALLIVGFGMTGLAMRRRPTTVAA